MSDKREEILGKINTLADQYKDEFEKQRKYFREAVNAYFSKNNKNKKEISIKKDDDTKENIEIDDPYTLMLDFLGRGDKGRREYFDGILDKKSTEVAKVHFLGIQDLTRAKFAHLKGKTVNEYKKFANDIKQALMCKDKNVWKLKECLDKSGFEQYCGAVVEPNASNTSVLYWLFPHQFVPYDKYTKKYLAILVNGQSPEEKLNWTEDPCPPKSNTTTSNLTAKWNEYCDKIHSIASIDKLKKDSNLNPDAVIALSLLSYVDASNPLEEILRDVIENPYDKKVRNVILTGIPGTGKTYSVMRFLEEMHNSGHVGEYDFVQFHPSYDYEDFIEGLKPVPGANNIEFKLVNGSFKDLCKKAAENAYDGNIKNIEELLSLLIKIENAENRDDLFNSIVKRYVDFLETYLKEALADADENNKEEAKQKLEEALKDQCCDLSKVHKAIETLTNANADENNKGEAKQKLEEALKTLKERILRRKLKKTYVFVIDEINRANLSRVFGELLYCLEYRDEYVDTKFTTYIKDNTDKDELSVDPREPGKFVIPNNVVVIGTMNEVDRSIDAFDIALRRRFVWEELGFDRFALFVFEGFFDAGMGAGHIAELVRRAEALNDKISSELGSKNFHIGHTYYFKAADYYAQAEGSRFESAMEDLWRFHIKSLLKEYLSMKVSEEEIEKKLEEFEKVVVKEGDGEKNGKK